MLRSTIYVGTKDELVEVIRKLEECPSVLMKRVKNRLNRRLRDIMINFTFKDQIICELQIKVGDGNYPPLYYANHKIYEIERLCDSEDRIKLADGLNRLVLHPTKNGKIIYDDN